MKLTQNFDTIEFECNDQSIMPAKVLGNVTELAKNLQVIRDHIGKPIRINSGYRSPEYNEKVGGVKKSQHLTGKAADMRVLGMSPKQLHDVILELIDSKKIKQGGIGLYPTFVHYDIRGKKARW